MGSEAEWESRVVALIMAAGEQQDPEEVTRLYLKALDELPEHARNSAYATQILSSLGEQYFLSGDAAKAFACFSDAVASEGGLGLSHIHFRLGQLRLERGEVERARDELMRAYMGSGNLLFDLEDPKYYALIKDVVEKK